MRTSLLTRARAAAGVMFLVGTGLAADKMMLKYEDLPALVQTQNKNALGAIGFLKSAEARRNYLKRSFLPILKAETGYESFKTGVFNAKDQPFGDLEARLNLYRGGRDRYEERVRQAEANSTSAVATRTYRLELLKARKAYWELVHVQEVADLLEEFVEQNKRHIAGAEKRAARGLTTETDRLGFQMIDLELREEIESQNHEKMLIEAELAPLIGVSVGTALETDRAVAHAHRLDLLEASVPDRAAPEIVQAEANRRASDLQRKSLLSLWKPVVDLYGGYYLYTLRERDHLDRNDRDDSAVGVKASLLLFEGFQSKNQADSFSRKVEAHAAQSEYLSAKLAADLYILKEELRHLDDLVHSSEKQIEVAKKYLARTMDEYNRGVKNAPDVMGAFEAHLHLQNEYAQRRRDYKRAEARLMELLGW